MHVFHIIMSTATGKLCRICLTIKENDNISETWCFTEILIQLVGDKYWNSLQLCMWCRSILKKTIALKNLALSSSRFHNSQNEVSSPINPHHCKYLQKLSFSDATHTDIPPDFMNDEIYDKDEHKNESQKQVNENVVFVENFDLHKNLNEVTIKETYNSIDFLGQEIEYQNENALPNIKVFKERQIKGNKHEKQQKNNKINLGNVKILIDPLQGNTKKNVKEINNEKLKKTNCRLDFKLQELQFVVKYLNLEEQEEEMRRKKNKYKDMKFQCQLCGVGFLTSDYFETHKIRHTKVAGPYKCSLCSLHFKNQLVLSQHMLSHKRTFSCMMCGVQFSKWSNCVVHRQKCGGRVMHVECTVCSKLFSDSYSLKAHARLHDLKEVYACERCGDKFKTKQRLSVHLRSHTGVKPFSCSSCSCSFTTNSNLRAHYRVHSDVSDHYCVECNTRYKSEKSLKRHLAESVRHVRDRSQVFKCQRCGKEFSTTRSLHSHQARHTGSLSELKCTHCRKIFSSKSNLSKHVKCIHKDILNTPPEQ